MKRVLCVVLIACLVPACSFAVDLADFNEHAMSLGEKKVGEADAHKIGEVTVYTAGNCSLIFNEDNENAIESIILQGNGISFLSYAMAAIMLFDNNPVAYSDNAGKLFYSFLLARTNGMQQAYTSSGAFFYISSLENGEFYFMIMKL